MQIRPVYRILDAIRFVKIDSIPHPFDASRENYGSCY